MKSITGNELLRLKVILPKVGLSKSGFYKAIRYGRIKPPIKVGRMSLWEASYIDSLIEKMVDNQFADGFTKEPVVSGE